MSKKINKEVWLDQIHVFPDQDGVYELDVPYVVEFEQATGITRTRKLEEDEILSIKNKYKIPLKAVFSDE